MAFDFAGMTFPDRDIAQEYEGTVATNWMWKTGGTSRYPYAYFGPMTSILSSDYLRFHSSKKSDAIREVKRQIRNYYIKVPESVREYVDIMMKKSKQDWVKEIRSKQREYWSKHMQELPREAQEKVAKVLGMSSTNPARRRRSTKRTNPTLAAKRLPRNQGVLLGKLSELELADGKFIRPRGLYLGYMPHTKGLCLMKKTGIKVTDKLSSYVRNRHKRFHGVPATKATVFEWPDRDGRLRDIGRIVSLTYVIPDGLKSPDKKRYRWRHAFGDHGEHGRGLTGRRATKYPARYQPMLQIDDAGALYIKRMPGNKFYVTDWLYW